MNWLRKPASPKLRKIFLAVMAIILTTNMGPAFIKKFENNSLHKFKSFDTRTA